MPTIFAKPVMCDHCGKLLWSIGVHGVQCSSECDCVHVCVCMCVCVCVRLRTYISNIRPGPTPFKLYVPLPCACHAACNTSTPDCDMVLHHAEECLSEVRPCHRDKKKQRNYMSSTLPLKKTASIADWDGPCESEALS